jgi:TonB family protein
LPDLVPAPERVSEKKWVPALPPLAVQPVLTVKAPPTLPEWQGLTARFDGAGPEVTAEVMGRLQAVAPQTLPAGATELLVSLDAAGQVRHVWLLRGSGDPVLDTAAMRAVQRSRFGARKDGFEGLLRIVWAPGAAPSM